MPVPRIPPSPARARAALTAGALLVASCAAPAPAGRSAVPIGLRSLPDGLAALAGGRPFAEIEIESGRPLLVRSLVGPRGTELLRPWRPDGARAPASVQHPEQRSMWIAYGDVEGVDLWSRPDRIQLTEESVVLEPGGTVRLRARLDWTDEDDGLLLTEDRTLRFRALEGVRIVDVDVVLTAPGRGLRFGDTKNGFFALRLAERFERTGARATGEAWIASGRETEDTPIWGERSPWCAVRGPSAGAGAAAGDTAERRTTVAVFDHPANPGHPTRWHVRPYGLLAANPFGRGAFEGAPSPRATLEMDAYERLRLRYRVFVTDEDVDSNALDRAWAEWVGVPAGA
ncbi:MAG: PmoA family protein [Planctomycetota bacterium]